MIINRNTPYYQYVRVFDAEGNLLSLCREIDTDKKIARRYVRSTDPSGPVYWPWPTEVVGYECIEVRPPPNEKSAAAQEFAGIDHLIIGDPLL